MFGEKKVVVVMPAYNAAKTLRQTYAEVRDQQIVDAIILVDDGSRDDTVAIARTLEGVEVHVHEVNTGYGGNQKTCYRLALEAGADIVIMIHPDYQYTPKLIPAMVSIIGNGLHPCVLGSRILGGYAMKGGMPLWKYLANRFLTVAENILLGAKLSEYHSGYRAFSRQILEELRLAENSDDFVFDNQMLAQGQARLFPVGCGAMNDARLSCLIKSGADSRQDFGGFLLLARLQQAQITFFECVQSRFGTAVFSLFAGAIAHPAFG